MFRVSFISSMKSTMGNANISSSVNFPAVYFEIPTSMLPSSPTIPYVVSEIRMKVLEFHVNPYTVYNDLYRTQTNIVNLDFFDAYGNYIEMQSLPITYDIYLPWSYERNQQWYSEGYSCGWWDTNFVMTLNETHYSNG